MSDDVQETPGPLRAALERRGLGKPKPIPTISDSTTITARFTLIRWISLMTAIAVGSVMLNEGYRDLKDEQHSIRADFERERQGNGELSRSVAKLADAVAALNITAAELRIEVREMKRQREGMDRTPLN